MGVARMLAKELAQLLDLHRGGHIIGKVLGLEGGKSVAFGISSIVNIPRKNPIRSIRKY